MEKALRFFFVLFLFLGVLHQDLGTGFNNINFLLLGAPDNCPPGYEYLSHENKCYGYHSLAANWNDARRKCQQFNGGDLCLFFKFQLLLTI